MTSEVILNRDVVVFENAASLSLDAAYRFVAYYHQAKAKGKPFRVALTGGTGAVGLYALLAEEPFSSLIDWSMVHLFFGDERYVPADSEHSNYLLAKKSLISLIPIPENNVHRIPSEINSVSSAASLYEEELRLEFRIKDIAMPQFDLILLGMGPDGHCASLFPNMPSLKEIDSLVVASAPGLAPFVERITLTLPVLNTAKQVLFLVHGGQKAEMVKNVLEGERDPDRYPSQSVVPVNGRVTWLIDRPAAGRLAIS